MIAAFVYLVACSFKNMVRTRLKRLRQPRYAAGLVVGVLYFYWILFQPGSRSSGRGSLASVFQTHPDYLLAGVSVLFFVIVAISWLVRSQLLAFTKSEVQFLFTAPVTRRELIHYKLIRGQVGSLLSSAILTIFLRPGGLVAALTAMVGVWLLFGLLNLHTTGIALTRTSLLEHGASGWRRLGWPALVVVGAVLTLVGVVIADWPVLSALSQGSDVARELVRLATTGAGGAVLWPFRAVAALPFAA